MKMAARARWAKQDERKKQSLRKKGIPLDRDAVEKIRQKNIGRKRSPEILEKLRKAQSNRSEETRSKIAKVHNKQVGCSNGCIYESAKHAAEQLGLNRSKISNVCTGKRKTTGGLVFWFIQ
jgi:hypothetical protein